MAKRHKDLNQDFASRRPQLNLKKETRIGVTVVVFLLLAVLLVLSLSGSAGNFGQVSNQVLRLAFGWVAYGVPLIFVMVALALLRERKEDDGKVSTHAYVGAVFMILAFTGLLHLVTLGDDPATAFAIAKEGRGGGYLGVLTSYPLIKLMGFIASLLVVLAGIVVSILVTFNVSLIDLFRRKDSGELPKS